MLKLLVNAIYLIAIIQAAVDTKEEFKTTSTTCINKCYKVGHTHCINSMFNKGVCCAYSDKKNKKNAQISMKYVQLISNQKRIKCSHVR